MATKEIAQKSNLTPVFRSPGGYAGILLLTAKGWKAFDAEDRPVGTFSDPDSAARALCEL